ncbi:hypothetical protein OIO90_004742 [Microbotryomycetes sp. JL221]|nr:hypothetical protein OIO90_004742 [Microbotryomycetes sp. JL221]
MPATIESLRTRHQQIVEQYQDHLEFVQQVQQHCQHEVLPALKDELNWDDQTFERATAFTTDTVTTFRFCRRARFALAASLKLIHSTLVWRFNPDPLESPLTRLDSPTKLDPLYTTNALFFFHPQLVDKFGRPCAVINLKHVQRTSDGQLDALKDVIRLGWEVGRRWLTDLTNQATTQDDVKLQIVVIVDLEGAGMSNLEVELLPFFMELLKNHFPGMIGAIFVLNYGWMYAGMWQLAKRVLPNTALERILFPTKPDLLEFFDEHHLLKEHGGTIEYTYSPDNPILIKYGDRQRYDNFTKQAIANESQSHKLDASSYPSPGPSPNASSSSLGSLPRRSNSRLSMTSLNSITTGPTSPGSNASQADGLGLQVELDQQSDKTNTEKTIPTTEQGNLSKGNFFWSWGRRKRSTGSSSSSSFNTQSMSVDKQQQQHHHHQRNGHESPGVTSGLRRVASLAELSERLAETQKAIDSDDSELGDEIAREEEEMALFLRSQQQQQKGDSTLQAAGPDRYHIDEEDDPDQGLSTGATSNSRMTSAATSARSSRFSSRVTSRNVSRQPSREASPARRMWKYNAGGVDGTDVISSRANKFSSSQSLSPYNSSNPYWGYPAFVPSSSSDPSRIPRPHYQRRRKRDLVRTLTYLAVLRFLALHRTLRNKVKSFVKTLLTVLGLIGDRNLVRDGGNRLNDSQTLMQQLSTMLGRHDSVSHGIARRNGSIPTTTSHHPTGSILLLKGSTNSNTTNVLQQAQQRQHEQSITNNVNPRKVVHWDSTSARHLDGTRRHSYEGTVLTQDKTSIVQNHYKQVEKLSTINSTTSLSEQLEHFIWLLIWFTILRTPNRFQKFTRFIKWSSFDLPVGVFEHVVSFMANNPPFLSTRVQQNEIGQHHQLVETIQDKRKRRIIKDFVGRLGQRMVDWSTTTT